MVIQRWQTVWLVLAVVLVSVFCFVPMALVSGQTSGVDSVTLLRPTDVPVIMIVNVLVALMLFIAIFLYRNTRRQKTVTLVSMLLLTVSMVTEALVIYGWNSAEGRIEWLGSIFLLIGALVFVVLAYRGISRDEKLLRSADRLR